METIKTNSNTGVAEATVTNTTPTKRGRPINPTLTKKVYLQKDNENYTLRKKGAPKPNTETYFVVVQRNVSTKDFVFNPQTMTVQTEIVPARNYKKVKTVEVTTPVVAETVHESAAATVTESADGVVVNSPAVV